MASHFWFAHQPCVYVMPVSTVIRTLTLQFFGLFILSFFLLSSSKAQLAEGFIQPNFFDNQETLSFPLYSEPGGEQAGVAQLVLKKAYGFRYMQAFLLEETDSLQLNIESDVFQVDRETSMLKYYEIEAGHARVFVHSTDQSLWIKMDLFEPVTWINQLIKFSAFLVYGYDNYRLRTSPSTEAGVVVKLNTRHHAITSFTGRVSGSWAEVVVVEATLQDGRELVDCYNLNNLIISKEYTGWLKVVDDAGQFKDIGYNHSC